MPIPKSTRLKLLKAIAGKLAAEEWHSIDLTLQEFGLNTSTVWNSNNKEAYALEFTRAASDDVLLELADHFSIATGLTSDLAQQPRPAFWGDNTFPLFVSHLASEKVYATELQSELRNFGISAFVAHKDITPTLEWQKEIEIALSTCGAAVALLHKGFHASNWTDQELGYAMGRGVPVFSVLLGEAPYGFIGKFQAFSGIAKPTSSLAREIFDALRKHSRTRDSMADVLMALFEASRSFAQANARMAYLQDLEVWKPEFFDRLDKALESNGQIAGAYDVPTGVDTLKEKWKRKS